MLIEFKFSNYRSFRDEGCLSMEPMGLSRMKECLIPYRAAGLLPSVALFGKNGGGKTNVIRAFWFGVKFICNAQRTQHETAPIPVQPFLLDDVSQNEPTAFEFSYMLDNIKYVYGFAATKTAVVKEYLYHSPKGQKAMVFSRNGQDFEFREGPDKKKRELISETVAPNQLYFSVACTMNEKACMSAMRWFREQLLFSRDYTDLSDQLIEHSENPNMLQAIKRYAIEADLGIQDMKFEVKSTELTTADQLPANLPEGIIAALKQFAKALSDDPNVSERKLQMGEVNVTSFHRGLDKEGQVHLYGLPLSVESDGTRQLMALAPAIEYVLSCGGVLLVDELENRIHPLLMQLIVSKFQSPKSNPNHAQLIFTTHNTELLDAGLIRKDQIYFVDKDKTSGSSSLYSISEFSTTTNENIRKGYLLGKYGATPDLDIRGGIAVARQTRKTKPLIYVFCEGESEQAYTRFLKERFSDTAVIKCVPQTGLFQEAKDKFDKEPRYRDNTDVTDEIWFFFDVEDDDAVKWDQRLKIIKYLRKLKKKPGIRVRLLMTTACIEYWLLLHYEMIAPPIHTVADKARILKRVQDFVPAYAKGDQAATSVIAQKYKTALLHGDRTLDALMADGMPVREDTDERSGWLCQSHKTFTTVQEAIQFLEAH